MDINVVHRYSHFGENLLRFTYVNLGVKLTGTLEVCDGCKISKETFYVVRSYKSGRKNFCVHNVSIPRQLNWEPLLDWRSR